MGSLRDVPKAVRHLAFGIFFNSAVAFTFIYLFVYLTDERGLAVAQAGVISGIGGVGLVAGNFTAGWFGDRFGHRRTLLTASVLAGAGLVALPALPDPLLYAVLPLAQYAQGAVRAANSALIAVSVPDGSRRQGFAVMRVAGNAGFTVGAPLGALVSAEFSYTVIFVADGIGTLLFALYAAMVLPLARPAARRHESRPAPGVWRELRARPAVLVLLVSVFFADIVYRQLFSTVPVFLGDHGMDTRAYGWLIAVNGAVILCLELPATVVLRGHAPLTIVGAGLVLVGLGYGALTLGASVPVALAMMLLLTAGEILYKTPATAYVADHAPDHAQGRFQSLYAGVSVSGVILAPPLGGALYATAPALLWPLSAALALAAGGAVIAAGRPGRATAGPSHGPPLPDPSRGAAPDPGPPAPDGPKSAARGMSPHTEQAGAGDRAGKTNPSGG
ncbi:MFS transporter [Streptomyces agglomeratus]|uniref:MFS transporter n=1 Tax=Streptomyces agglomeratus TaxID=285458 RepID=UPI00085406C5|nr:MFS transporter [Streptomyces agglomeratus]OEJ51010.1 multidrug transporter [Streptomyces agglomeratus]